MLHITDDIVSARADIVFSHNRMIRLTSLIRNHDNFESYNYQVTKQYSKKLQASCVI